MPKYPGGVILHYDILFLSTNTSVMATPGSVAATVQVGPDETQYNVAGAKLPDGDYFVQVSGLNSTIVYTHVFHCSLSSTTNADDGAE